jgi:hypothetical protein
MSNDECHEAMSGFWMGWIVALFQICVALGVFGILELGFLQRAWQSMWRQGFTNWTFVPESIFCSKIHFFPEFPRSFGTSRQLAMQKHGRSYMGPAKLSTNMVRGRESRGTKHAEISLITNR